MEAEEVIFYSGPSGSRMDGLNVYHFISGGLVFGLYGGCGWFTTNPSLKPSDDHATRASFILKNELVGIMVYFSPHFTEIDDGVDK